MTQNIIIVGAPRSGTNMLRDLLTQAPSVATWDCDEINLMWKHGNLDVAHDELGPDLARPRVAAYLRGQFAALARREHALVVVEKTCATSLRVPFVHAVFPDALLVFIRRDGLDAAASAMKRWNAPFDLSYTMKKVRYTPALDIPRHFAGFAQRRLTQVVKGESGRSAASHRVSTWWGPRPRDYRALQQTHPLEELAFIQWQRCIEQTSEALETLSAARHIDVIYEDVVRDPRAALRTILDEVGRGSLVDAIDVSGVRADGVGKGRGQLGAEVVARLEGLGAQTLEKFGYG